MGKIVWDIKSQFENYKNDSVFDCMIAEFLLSEGRSVTSLESVFQKYGVTTLEELSSKQKEKLKELPKLNDLLLQIEIPLAKVLWKMEKEGILLDIKELKEVGIQIDAEIKKVEEIIKKEVGFEINLNSSIQIGNYLAEKEGVPLSKTKTGRYATNENEMAQYATQFPIIQQLLSYRELSKLRSTYVDSLIDKVDEKGRIHTSYNQVAVNTGRLSSSNPNLQNIPVTSEFGQKIKSCFISQKDTVLLSFDYSQQELRILAHLTGEEKLIEAFKNNKDVHKTTASQLFKVDYSEVTKEQRTIAKTINFGIIYGMSGYGMSMGLQIPVEDARLFIEEFYKTYPRIKTYYDSYLKQGKIDGYVETLLGRRRYVFEYPNKKFIDNGMRRVLMNYPIQGTAADLIKKAMVQIQEEVLEKEQRIKLLLQIHDDLVFEVKNEQEVIEEVSNKIRNIMCGIYPLSVPIEVDVKIGNKWGELQPLKS